MNRTQQKWFAVTLGVAALGLLALVRSSSERSSSRNDNAVVESRSPAEQAAPWWSSEIPSRRVDSAARADYEGVETDDWDTLGPEGRMARVTETIASLERDLEAATTAEDRESLRDQALQVLASARADFFMDASSKQWYLREEARLEAK